MNDRQPAKVIKLFTKKEMKELPYTQENAHDIMSYLMQYKNPRTNEQVTQEEYNIIDQLLFMVENNSGTEREEVFKQEA